ncbi:hypothetical protein AYI69_g4346 [Smittium culicis]|uniref:Uncharacterized protein n=1 Tax=Smittium culicis TaxID=133412 RepID=A0A1R1YED7_9FUNG|nr:hypothetical protein AYI69_g4346 [Smittium culicis]
MEPSSVCLPLKFPSSNSPRLLSLYHIKISKVGIENFNTDPNIFSPQVMNFLVLIAYSSLIVKAREPLP